ncbi:SH3 domain-containing protein [Caloramator sp. Dgby_cultured_2]|uniref:SH3 domain-containing protein n=1 Tax=Caloramator sp. Dgby_cultured_2 TaxID=3029174 RepID=UPI00237E2D31|nr:SH3 domain-containing protein [Caloramator sp. Dgby_cultured_2]WDU84188.1 SH3 domain-containing protein [Caloramator sp. Dgby_cultured_2]
MGKASQTKKGQVLATTLNIREQPFTSAKILGTYKKGGIIEIIDENEGWYKTNKGWVCKDYVKILN